MWHVACAKKTCVAEIDIKGRIEVNLIQGIQMVPQFF